MNENPQILTSLYDYLLYLIQRVEKFPRSQRYLLGERIENLGLEILEMLIDATYSKDKMEILRRVNVKLEQLRYHVRLCKDVKLINLHHYEVMSKSLNDIGTQLGGWIKQQAKKS